MLDPLDLVAHGRKVSNGKLQAGETRIEMTEPLVKRLKVRAADLSDRRRQGGNLADHRGQRRRACAGHACADLGHRVLDLADMVVKRRKIRGLRLEIGDSLLQQGQLAVNRAKLDLRNVDAGKQLLDDTKALLDRRKIRRADG